MKTLALFFFLFLLLILAACDYSPSVKLDMNRWTCTKIETRRTSSMVVAGHGGAVVPMEDIRNYCVQYSWVEQPGARS